MNQLIVLSLVCLTLAWATSSSENKEPSTNGENSDDPNMQTRNRRWTSDIASNPLYHKVSGTSSSSLHSIPQLSGMFSFPLNGLASEDPLFYQFFNSQKTSSQYSSPRSPQSFFTPPLVQPSAIILKGDLGSLLNGALGKTIAGTISSVNGGSTFQRSSSPPSSFSLLPSSSTYTDHNSKGTTSNSNGSTTRPGSPSSSPPRRPSLVTKPSASSYNPKGTSSNLNRGLTRPSSQPPSPLPRPSSPTPTDNLQWINANLLNAKRGSTGTSSPPSSPSPYPSPVTQPIASTDHPRDTSSNRIGGSSPPGHLPYSNIYSNEQQNDITNDIKDECPCGESQRREGRVIGGWETKNHYDWLVGFRKIMKGSYSQVVCMGARIADGILMSARHCFDDILPKDIVADFGGHNMSKIVDSEELIKVVEIILHPEYMNNGTAVINDIALVILEHETHLTKAGLICLYRSNQDLTGQHLKIIGWGIWNENGSQPDLLQEGELVAISVVTCRMLGFRIIDEKKQLCLMSKNMRSAEGDSGGSSVWEHPTTKRLYSVGVVSYGVKDLKKRTSTGHQTPTMLTYVQAFIPWMEETIKARRPNTNMCALRRPMLVY